MLDIVYHKSDVFFHIKQMEVFRMLLIFQSHAGAAYQLQLMHFQGSKGETGQGTGLCHNTFVRLARQSEDDMSAGQDATSSSPLHSIDGSLEGMPAIDTLEGFVAGAFYTVLYQQKSMFINLFQICLLYTSPSPRDRG